MLPPDVYGWNVPFFGNNKRTTSQQQQATPNESITSAAAAATMGMAGAAADKLNNVDPTLSPINERMFGPMDAPHLRYIPSYFSNQIPDKLKQVLPLIASRFHKARTRLYHLLWYKPPVGIVSIWGFMRVMERVYGLYNPPAPTSGEEALLDAEGKLSGIVKSLMPGSSSSIFSSPWGQVGQKNAKVNEESLDDLKAQLKHSRLQLRRKKRKKKYRKGRCFDLDRGDHQINNFGGIETVKVRVCREGLMAALAISAEPESDKPQRRALFGNTRVNDSDAAFDSELTADIEAALEALAISCPPKGSREYFVEQSVTALSRLQKYLTADSDLHKSNGKAPSIREQNMNILLSHASKVIELRILDALLRILRDRHLVVSSRLRRAQSYWKWRLNISSGKIGRLAQRILSDVQLFLQWSNSHDFRDKNQKEYERITAACERELLWLGSVENVLLERPPEMETADLFSVLRDQKSNEHWWNGIFEGNNSVDEESLNLSNEAKYASMVDTLVKGKNRMWLRQSENWSRKARSVLADSLDSTVSSSFTPINCDNQSVTGIDEDNETIYAESQLLRKWAAYDDTFSDTSSWLAILSMVDFAASHQRAGEQRQFQFSGLTSRLRQYDFLAIPSTALMLAAANSLHDKVIDPHRQEIIDFVRKVFQAIWGIIEFRFYTPMKDIVLDLLNRRPRMVDPFALMNEQKSLDNMLKDLGVGDGTRAGRASALASASRMYEEEVAGGAIRGIVRGRVAQLMLIQIQQLKADLLQGMWRMSKEVNTLFNDIAVQLKCFNISLFDLSHGSNR